MFEVVSIYAEERRSDCFVPYFCLFCSMAVKVQERVRLNYFRDWALRRIIMEYRWDNFVSDERVPHETGDVHDTTTPTAIISSLGKVPGV